MTILSPRGTDKVLCAGSTHVYLTGSLRCTCGAAANGYPPTVGVAMYDLPTSYNPFSPHAPATPTADVPLHIFKAARDAGATHLSGDGLRAYRVRMGKARVYYWNEETKAFGSDFPFDGELPADVVPL